MGKPMERRDLIQTSISEDLQASMGAQRDVERDFRGERTVKDLWRQIRKRWTFMQHFEAILRICRCGARNFVQSCKRIWILNSCQPVRLFRPN